MAELTDEKNILDFESEEGFKKSIRTLKREYILSIIRAIIQLILFGFIGFNINSLYILVGGIFKQNSMIVLTITTVIILILLYSFYGISKIVNHKFSISLLSFLEFKVDKLGFKIRRGFKTLEIYIILNILNLIAFFLLDRAIDFYSFNTSMYYFILNFMVFITIIIWIVPLIIGVFLERYVVRLKNGYKIKFYLRFEFNEEIERFSIKIYMESNSLSRKGDIIGKQIYDKIIDEHWLPHKGKSIIHRISNKYRFFERATPWNFERQFLNLVLALKDWDIYYYIEKLLEHRDYSKALNYIESFIAKKIDIDKLTVKKCEILDKLIENGVEKEKNSKKIKRIIKYGLKSQPLNVSLMKLKKKYE